MHALHLMFNIDSTSTIWQSAFKATACGSAPRPLPVDQLSTLTLGSLPVDATGVGYPINPTHYDQINSRVADLPTHMQPEVRSVAHDQLFLQAVYSATTREKLPDCIMSREAGINNIECLAHKVAQSAADCTLPIYLGIEELKQFHLYGLQALAQTERMCILCTRANIEARARSAEAMRRTMASPYKGVPLDTLNTWLGMAYCNPCVSEPGNSKGPFYKESCHTRQWLQPDGVVHLGVACGNIQQLVWRRHKPATPDTLGIPYVDQSALVETGRTALFH